MSSTVEITRQGSSPAGASGLGASITPPRTVIGAQPGWKLLNARELWSHRELLYFLTWRDIKVRYKQTALGACWAVLQPLATMAVFTVFLGRVVATPESGVPYPLYVFAGLLPWHFFSNAVGAAGQSVVANHSLVTKIYFPRLLIPAGAVGASVVDLAVASALFAPLMLYFGVVPGAGILMTPLVVAGLLIAALGFGTLLSALTVAYRDFRHIIPFMLQFWMFATPTIYMQADTVVGPTGRALLPLNPAYGLIKNLRVAILGGTFDWYALGVSGAVAVTILVVGFAYFRRVERGFADII
ncbi:ABC transporter permease [Tautonia plasticadhaerens]|uniref:Transport permease protein n=1 Tax=Tautonia plasticadhaerens TaxID=2527974 RepID=A0A518HFY4_9BACT|nr:ABC transporter permease [Tautonia plasticadhaerens]QDV39696.1 Teichoic acid translocation permease protein TagG [Tautonia plasticadhaerens]